MKKKKKTAATSYFKAESDISYETLKHPFFAVFFEKTIIYIIYNMSVIRHKMSQSQSQIEPVTVRG